MKKLIKWLFILAAVFVFILAAGLVTLKIMYPFSKLKAMGQDYVAQNYNRQMDLEDISFNFIGVTIDNFKLSEEGGFENGTFASAKQAVLKVEFMPLLSKQIKIKTIGFDGVDIQIIKDKDGKFNFDNLAGSSATVSQEETQTQQEEKSSALDITAKDMYIKNSDITYKDLQGGSEFAVNNVNFSIENFDYNSPFNFLLSLNTAIDTGDIKLNPVEISAEGKADIAGMDLQKAFLDITSFKVAYKHFNIDMAGSVSNLAKPNAALKGTINGIDKKFVSEFTKDDMAQFALPAVNIDAAVSADLDDSKADISKFNIALGKSYINTAAKVDYGNEDLIYNGDTDISISLTEVSQIAKDTLSEFKLAGLINGKLSFASAKQTPSVNGTVTLKDVAATLMQRPLTKVNGTVTLKSVDNIKTNVVTGVFDGADFKTSVSYLNNKKPAVDFMFEMDKFTLDDIDFNALMASSKEEKPDGDETETQQAETAQSQTQTDPMDIKADILIKRVENNVFSTDNLTLKADIKDLDTTMKKAQGTLTFSAYEGEIRDLDKLINSSVLLKVILTTVKISQKAFKAANVISGKDIDTDKVNYHSVIGDYTLGGGIATVNKSDLNSDLATVTTSGNVNFVTEQLDLKVKIGLGKNAASSAAVKVGGSINEPSYKIDVASTVGSLLKGIKSGDSSAEDKVQNVKTAVKDVTGGIKNLFKKK